MCCVKAKVKLAEQVISLNQYTEWIGIKPMPIRHDQKTGHEVSDKNRENREMSEVKKNHINFNASCLINWSPAVKLSG